MASTINALHGPRKPGTVGLPFPGQQVAIADDAGQHLPRGQIGEVIIRGANVMRGYLGKPEATAEALRGGWLHTGDVGYLDADGYLVLVDRKKDMIIRGGENIYPKEVENVLHQHPPSTRQPSSAAPTSPTGNSPSPTPCCGPARTRHRRS